MKRIIVSLFLALMMVGTLSLPVYAIADPDTPPSINAVYIYEGCLEDGDVGALIDIYLDYTTNPDETVTEAYLVSFIDSDGTTILKTVAPYTYTNSGYGHNLVWIYFTADEVTTYSISSADEANYKVWLMGNPTLSWAGDPPKTASGIDYWQPSGSNTASLIALRVLYYADILELEWSLDLIEITALGNRLTTLGEGYFENVITNLRDIAPAAFSAGQYDPKPQNIDYNTEFSAVATGAIIAGTPVTLAEGANTITATGTGTFVIELAKGTSGTVVNALGSVTGSPVDISEGTNTLTVTGAGTLTVTVNLTNTTSLLEDTISGTGFDLTDAATAFGMSRWMFSGLVWMLVSFVICAGVYSKSNKKGVIQVGGTSTKLTMLVFDVCIIAGGLLGLLHPIVAILLFIGFGTVTGLVVFFKGANI